MPKTVVVTESAKFTLAPTVVEQHRLLQRLVLLDVERNLIIERLTTLSEPG